MNTITHTRVAIDQALVECVYSGRHGCACGCKGNYRYPERHRDNGQQIRGYDIDAEEINERQIARIIHKVEAIANGDEDGEIDMINVRWISANQGNRTYAVYFDNPQPGFVEAHGHVAKKIV